MDGLCQTRKLSSLKQNYKVRSWRAMTMSISFHVSKRVHALHPRSIKNQFPRSRVCAAGIAFMTFHYSLLPSSAFSQSGLSSSVNKSAGSMMIELDIGRPDRPVLFCVLERSSTLYWIVKVLLADALWTSRRSIGVCKPHKKTVNAVRVRPWGARTLRVSVDGNEESHDKWRLSLALVQAGKLLRYWAVNCIDPLKSWCAIL